MKEGYNLVKIKNGTTICTCCKYPIKIGYKKIDCEIYFCSIDHIEMWENIYGNPDEILYERQIREDSVR